MFPHWTRVDITMVDPNANEQLAVKAVCLSCLYVCLSLSTFGRAKRKGLFPQRMGLLREWNVLTASGMGMMDNYYYYYYYYYCYYYFYHYYYYYKNYYYFGISSFLEAW